MSEVFHYEDGRWVGYGDDHRTFRDEQVKEIVVEKDEKECFWCVFVVLKDGTRICPDYTTWCTKEGALAEAHEWADMILGMDYFKGIRFCPKDKETGLLAVEYVCFKGGTKND